MGGLSARLGCIESKLAVARTRGARNPKRSDSIATPEQRRRLSEEICALTENARVQLAGEPPPNVIPPPTPEDIADGWWAHDWLRVNWTQGGERALAPDEAEFLEDWCRQLEEDARRA